MPRNLKMVLEYDGSAYVGWERQKNGLAVQEVLERAVHTITRERVVVEGSGRTDAGVHARGQVASFRLERDIHLRKLRLGINAVTPPDVSVLSISEARPEFHARRSAVSKWYRYTILNASSSRPLVRHVVYHHPRSLDVDGMARAAALLEGTHDFRAFAKEAQRKRSCVRTILGARVRREEPFIHVDLEGTGFLYNMVRIVVGTLIEAGSGRREPESVADLLGGPARRADAGFTAPPEGLALMEVRYPSDEGGGSPLAAGDRRRTAP